jgi:hypothetical protein
MVVATIVLNVAHHGDFVRETPRGKRCGFFIAVERQRIRTALPNASIVGTATRERRTSMELKIITHPIAETRRLAVIGVDLCNQAVVTASRRRTEPSMPHRRRDPDLDGQEF